MYKLHNHCRACGLGKPAAPTLKVSCAAGPQTQNNQLIPVMDLGLQPLANDFANGTEEHSGFAPLKVMLCPRCGLGQLSVVVNPKELYSRYSYVTSQSNTMYEHFDRLIADIEHVCGVKGSVIEIGSNDGTLLAYMKKCGFDTILGIDPAENLVKKANQSGIRSRCAFFDDYIGKETASAYGKPDVIIARHVFCHIDDWSSVIKGLSAMSDAETVVCIEVPYVMDMLKEGEWDTIYHEHLSYMSVKSLEYALANSNLHIHGIKHYTIHGGAIVLFLRHNDFGKPPNYSVEEYLINEKSTVERWQQFANISEVKVMQLGGLVRNLKAEGKTVVGYGASAKSTVWLNSCGFTRNQVSWICDTTHLKQYKLSPGTDIPIVDPGALTRELPDYAILWAWNYAPEIIAKEEIFRAKGGRWIIPTPSVEVV